MRQLRTAIIVAGVIGLIGLAPPVLASHNRDIHSKNAKKLERDSIRFGKNNKRRAQGSDLAIQKRLVVAGAYEGIGFFKRARGSSKHRQVSFYNCPGSQGDVSILGDFVFISIDSPASNSKKTGRCNNTPTNESNSSLEKEGIRIIDISNLRRPRQVAFVETECGSHTHTLIPKGSTTYMYVDSYPIAQSASCNDATHPEGEFSVLEFPTGNPKRAKVVSTPDVLPPTAVDAIGCHDTGVLPRKNLAVAACLGAFSVLDISDPAAPKVLSTVQNPAIELDHSAAITWDGKVAVVSDEHAGAAGGGGCSTDQNSAVGAMWYYDISDPADPVLKGSFSLPRVPTVDSPEESERFRCTTHNWNILRMKDPDKYIVVSAYYSGGFSVINFSDPTAPKERAFYLPQVKGKNPDMWSAYWYNGRIYSNEHSSLLGVSVFKVRGLGRRNVHFFRRRLNPQTQIGAV